MIFFTIFAQEILLLKRNFNKILANFLFFIISAVIFLLLGQGQENLGSSAIYNMAIIWFSLLFLIIFSAGDFAKRDFEDGTIEQIMNSVDNLEIYILAKSLALFFVNILPVAIAATFLTKLTQASGIKPFAMFMLIILTGICINFICCFCGSLSILGNSAPMISIIAMPLIVPIMLISFGGIINDSLTSSCKILLGISVLSACCSIFASAKIIKIASE